MDLIGCGMADYQEVGVSNIQMQKALMPKLYLQLTNDMVLGLTVWEWLNVKHEIKNAIGEYYGRTQTPAYDMPMKGNQMDLFDKFMELTNFLPEEDGEVSVRFILPEDSSPEQSGTAAALNDIGHLHEPAISALCKRTGMRCEVLDSEGDCLRIYFPDGAVMGVAD